MTHASHKEAREAGWHSRRHQTRDAQDAAREQYKAERGSAARVRRAKGRAFVKQITRLTPEERLLAAIFGELPTEVQP